MITVNWDPNARTLRQFAAAGSAVLVAMALVAYLRGGSWTAVVLLALAAGLGAAAWLRPAILRLPYVLLTYVTFPIGLVVSHLILLLLFFGVITPLGLLARIVRPDPLGAPWDQGVRSYWQRRSRPRDPSSYLRQA